MSKSGRSQWFQDRATVHGGEADAKGAAESRSKELDSQYRWDSLGPNNIAGRTTCLVVDRDRPGRLLAGSACGGVWVCDNIFAEDYLWRATFDCQMTLNIGALAADPNDPNIIYCGTGEANNTLDSYPGLGMYRSEDGGETWRSLAQQGQGYPKRICSIAVDPFQKDRALVGSGFVVPGEIAGLDELTNHPTQGWEFTFVPNFSFRDGQFVSTSASTFSPYRCYSVVFHPGIQGLAFAAVDFRGWRSGIWRSRDGGANWERCKKGLPSGELFGRTSLAIAPSDPNVIWAYAAHTRDRILGVFVSYDCGDSWHSVGGEHFSQEESTDYNNCIAVHPQKPELVICGGVDLHRTVDGGRNWEQVTEWNLPIEDPRYVHGDHHGLAFSKAGVLYSANDGGIALSDDFDGRCTWQTRSQTMVTTMFYDIDVAPSNAKVLCGGAQDNGTLFCDRVKKLGEFVQVLEGDGGWTVFDPEDDGDLWGSSQNIDIQHHSDGSWENVSPPVTDKERNAVWMSFIEMDTSPKRAKPRPVFVGSTRIWKTRSGGSTWYPVSPVLDGSPITAIEVSDADSRFVYAGTKDGGFFRSTDGGNTWSENLVGVELPYSLITRIAAHPSNPLFLLVTIGATPKPCQTIPYSHIFGSMDGGLTWLDADPEHKLPSLPHNCVVFETEEPFSPFVATDVGVFGGNVVPLECGAFVYDWINLTGNLPNVIVTDLVYHSKSKTITAATYGRGIFRLAPKKIARKSRSRG